MKRITIILFVFICIGLISFIPPKAAQNTGVVVIVNVKNPVETMTAGHIKLTFLKKIRKRWDNYPKTIKPIDYFDNTMLRKSFYNNVLKMDLQAAERFFLERQYQRAEIPPKKVNYASQVISYVTENEGAIGYLPADIKIPSTVKIVYRYP
jgi:ABC-type phosphate transport system substrate-binding protein